MKTINTKYNFLKKMKFHYNNNNFNSKIKAKKVNNKKT